jgi:hypothetical protein
MTMTFIALVSRRSKAIPLKRIPQGERLAMSGGGLESMSAGWEIQAGCGMGMWGYVGGL